MLRKIITIAFLFGSFLWASGCLPVTSPDGEVYHRAEILSVEEESFGANGRMQLVTAQTDEGEIFALTNEISEETTWWSIPVAVGDRVFLVEDQGNHYIAEYERDDTLFYLLILFLIVLVVVGGWEGAKAVIALGLTILLVGFIIFPAALKGYNPILPTILCSVLVSGVTFLLLAGWSRKTLGALVGTGIGLAIAGFLALLVGNQANMTGLASESSRILAAGYGQYDFEGILFAGIIVGALGAVMDVGISIASAINEIHDADPDLPFRELFRSGMHVGRDIAGTMANTLVLAYAGSALPLILLFLVAGMPMGKIFNLEIIAEEIIRALAGSTGLILCIPITAAVTAWLETRTSEKSQLED